MEISKQDDCKKCHHHQEIGAERPAVSAGARWKKLENSLRFIYMTRQMSRESKTQNYHSPENQRKSKWTLLRNVWSAINFLMKSSLTKLKLEKVMDNQSKDETEKVINEIPKKTNGGKNTSDNRRNKYWKILRNSLYWIR